MTKLTKEQKTEIQRQVNEAVFRATRGGKTTFVEDCKLAVHRELTISQDEVNTDFVPEAVFLESIKFNYASKYYARCVENII